ncbi:hypothetical protein [Porphyromonas loveana]
MGRSIREIKRQMTGAYVAHPDIVKAYGLSPGKTFEEQFSKVSLESILFYVIASALWLVEEMVHRHRTEVDELIATLKPHSLRWYAHMSRLYMHGYQLIPDTDRYDLEGLSEEQIKDARVVRYAVATEASTIVYIKVAGEDDFGRPAQLREEILAGFKSYIDEVKDAGVAVEVVSQPADSIRLNLELHVPSHLLYDTNSLNVVVSKAIDELLSSVPFDGVLRLSHIVQALEALPEVEVAVLLRAEAKAYSAIEWTDINGFYRPYSGYCRLDGLGVNYRSYNKYDGL